MTSVAVHLTDSGVWASSAGREWNGPIGDDAGPGLSPLSFVDSGFRVEHGRAVPVGELLATALSRAVAQVRHEEGPLSICMSSPTHWGSARRRVLGAAAQAVAADVRVVPVALAATEICASQQEYVLGVEQWLVVECGRLETTVSRVRRRLGVAEVLHCEIEPELGIGDSQSRPDDYASTVVRAAGSDPVDAVFVLGDESGAVRSVLDGKFGRAPVSIIEGRRVARELARLGAANLAAVAEAAALRRSPVYDSAAASEQWRGRAIAASVAAGVGLVAVVGTVVVLRHNDSVRSSESAAAVAAQQVALGNVRVSMPAGWRVRLSEGADNGRSARLELVATEGPDRKIIVTQSALNPGVGYDGVVTRLADLIARGGRSSKFGALEPDVVFGGRKGIAYKESPDVYSHVKWHVIVEHDTQVSVGCQSLVGDWESLAGECEQLVRTMVVVP